MGSRRPDSQDRLDGIERQPIGAAEGPSEGGNIMKNPQIERSKTPRGRRGIVLLVAGAIALAVGVTGGYAALAGGSSSLRARQEPTAPFTSAPPVAPATVTDPASSVTPSRSSPT